MAQKIVTTNLRVPENMWIQIKSHANSLGISVNEYAKQLFKMDIIRTITGTRKKNIKAKGYDAMTAFINRQRRGKPMGASDDDKVIYGIED